MHPLYLPTLQAAPALLGWRLLRGEVVLRIVETEAYLPGDSACHASKGRTARTEVMFGPPGRAYVYLCYGLHHLLNLVTEPEGIPGCVLVRGAVVEQGAAVVAARRGGRLDCVGPGKVAQALALDRGFTGQPLDGSGAGGLLLAPGPPPARVQVGPRVGIDYALPEHRDAPWRFRALSLPD